MALLTASSAAAAVPSVSMPVLERPREEVLIASSVKLSESSLSVPVPSLKDRSRLDVPEKACVAAVVIDVVAANAVFSEIVKEPS